MAVVIPYETELTYIDQEVGPVSSYDLLYFIRKAPIINSETMSFDLRFEASEGEIHGSSADIIIDPIKARPGLEKIVVPSPGNESQFLQILNGGKLETLDLGYPSFSSPKDAFASGAKAFEILKDNLEILQKAGYELNTSPFRIGHYIVELPSPQGFIRGYGAKVYLRTTELLKGKPERKLVLSFTKDVELSREVIVYREILNLFNASRE